MARTERHIAIPVWLSTFLLCGLAELLSLFTWLAPELGPVVFGAYAGVALVTALRDPRAGFLLLTAEAVFGGHGHLFAFGPVSIRMVIFGATVLGWLISMIRVREARRVGEPELLGPLAAVAATVAWGVMRGLMTGRGVSDVIDDANGYAFILAIPMALALFRAPAPLHALGEVFAGAVLWLSVKSLTLLYLFSHAFGALLEPVRLWQRQFFLAELTPMDGWTRTFSASDIFLVPTVFLGVLLLWKTRRRRWSMVVVPVAALTISYARSLWLGVIVGTVALAAWLWHSKAVSTSEDWRLVRVGIVTKLAALALLAAVIFFPAPPRRLVSANAASENRLRAADAAVTSRWNMLPPLERAISAHPIIGNGFSATITYQSDDPRIHALYPGGVITTSAIEWQYLELWLKMGFGGLLAIGWLFLAIARQVWAAVQTKNDGIVSVAALASFVAFIVANVFTPYINHPLGWMFLALTLVAIQPRPGSR